MQTQTISATAATVLATPRASLAPSADQFSVIASCSGLIATEFSYRKDEEIYGEGEPSEYVYQVIRGAVRTYKLLSDGRRQIGAFHLAGDVFGLDPGTSHRLTAEAITDYLDGKIARAFGLESRLGQLLDPVADRLYIAATLVGLAVREVIPWWFVWLLVAREVLLAVVMLVLKRAGQTGLPVNVVGKAATLNLLYAFPLLLLGTFDGWVGTAASIVGWAMVWWGVYLYWVAAGLYVVQASRVLGQLRRLRAAGLPDRPAGPGRGAPA